MNRTFLQLGIALGLGLLVGLQRESRAFRMAGVRTFPLVTILGTVCSLLGPWAIPAGFIALAALIFVEKRNEQIEKIDEPGLTTEVAILLMFGVGASLSVLPYEVPVVIGAGVAVLLQMKDPLHGLVSRLGGRDVMAIMQFALIALVILPVLPDEAYGPYDVWNPRQIWKMVVLVVGIDLAAYIAYRFWGERQGLILGGVLGGVISSTATAVAAARRSRTDPDATQVAAATIVISSATVYLRLLALLAALAPAAVSSFAGRYVVLSVLMLPTLYWLWPASKGAAAQTDHQNPSELKPAILFGIMFAFALLAVAYARDKFGLSGLYTVAGLAGLTDVDAITLSTVKLLNAGSLSVSTGWRVVLFATLANLAFKLAAIAWLGNKGLWRKVAPAYALALTAGLAMMISPD